MRLHLLASLVVVFIPPACKKKQGPEASVVIARMEQYRDNTCTCTDPVCVHHVGEELVSWWQATEKREGTIDTDAWSAKDRATYTKIMKQRAACMARASK